MKTSLFYTLAAVGFLFCSCGNDIQLDDSHFVAFTLTVDGTAYQASIADNTITVSAPSNVDLTHAKVSYQLSEEATVIPEPSTIDNWSVDQVFRVQSQSGKYVSYQYTTNRSEVCEDGSVMLSTQTDVDNFAKKNINHISGNLIIGASNATTDSIKNLDGLKSVTDVDYNVVVNGSLATSDLAGLINLKRVGGFYLGSENNGQSMSGQFSVELPSLVDANNIVIHSDSVKTISMPALSEVGNFSINSIYMNALNLSALATCYGNISIKGMIGTSFASASSNLVLATLSLPALTKVYGTLLIEDFWNITKFDIPKLQEVGGDLQLMYVRGTKKIAFPELVTVAGATNIQANDGMTSFSAPKLTNTTSLNIASLNSYSINLTKVDLSSLQTVTTNFTLQYSSVTDLNLPKLTSVGSKLLFNLNQYMETLSMPELKNCSNLTIQSSNVLGSLSLDKLTDVSTLQLDNETSLQTLSLKSLEKLDNFMLRYSYSFTTLNAPKLTTITGALTFAGGKSNSTAAYSVTTNLNGFASLTNVGKVAITYGGNLADFSGLKNVISNMTASNWSVKNCQYNPTYQNMADGKYTAE